MTHVPPQFRLGAMQTAVLPSGGVRRNTESKSAVGAVPVARRVMLGNLSMRPTLSITRRQRNE
jgi:hypothetical protein